MTDDKINIAELAHIGRTGKICEDACRIQNAESGCYCAMVADALLAQAAEIARLTAERDDAIRAKDCFQRMTRAHWEALCAMRNSINEYIPMPNTDSGPLFSPEDGPIYADIAERVIADLTESRAYALALEQELRDRADPSRAVEMSEAAAFSAGYEATDEARQADLSAAARPGSLEVSQQDIPRHGAGMGRAMGRILG